MANSIKSTDAFLADLQANILKGHGRNFAHHIFIRFDQKQIQATRDWIKRLATTTLTSAAGQLQASARFNEGKTTDGGPVFTFSLSATGYDKLGLTHVKPDSSSFNDGMKKKADILGDNPATWEPPFQEIDALLIIADDNSNTAALNAGNMIAELSAFAQVLHDQRGNVLKTQCGIGIEHFGYADGISQPLFLASDIAKQPSVKEWDDATDISLLLVEEKGSEGGAQRFGSFLVFRKLEQNVKAFKDAEGDNAVPGVLPVIKDVDGNDNSELAGAMLVGRFENGTPVINSSIEAVNNPPKQTNDFNYTNDTGAIKCPFHAHIRLMNPRNGDVQAGDVREHRITRRGIPYDEAGRIPLDRITSISDDLLDNNQPEKGVGLLFMCYQSQIENQFEILQAFWANKGLIFPHQTDGQDSLISQGTNPPKTLPRQWGQPAQTNPFSFDGFVKMKGGEYFFTPSIPFLSAL